MSDPMRDSDGFPGLLAVMRCLVEVMEREIDLLHGMKSSELQAVQSDKLTLANAYQARVKALRDGRQALDPALRAEFSQAAQSFQDTLLRNHQALNAAKATTDRVLQAIVREVEKQRRQQGGYSANGQSDALAGAKRAVSVAIDQRL